MEMSSWRSGCSNLLVRLNPDLPTGALDDAFRKLTRPDGSALEASQSRPPPYAG